MIGTITLTHEAMDLLDTLPPYIKKSLFVATVVGNCRPNLNVLPTTARERTTTMSVRRNSKYVIRAIENGYFPTVNKFHPQCNCVNSHEAAQ